MARRSVFILCFVLGSFLVSCSDKSNLENNEIERTKNVILMITDGQSIDIKSYMRWHLGDKKVARDEFASGLVRTHNSDTPIGDSAPTATAMASGYKTRPGFIGVLPEKDKVILEYSTLGDFEELQPIASILEAARLRGMSTGIISTSETLHATPASFTSHDRNRGDYEDIAEQQLYQGVDLIFGGGYTFFSSDYREDKQDLIKEFENEGYQIIRTKAELDALDAENVGRIWGVFADRAMAYDIDRRDTEEPSIAEMTEKAIEILSKNENGFFLMVEGSKIDWAGHSNDPVSYVYDSIAFEDAASIALEFTKTNNDTMFFSVSDHSTSGFRMGNFNVSSGYNDLEDFLIPISLAKNSSQYVANLIANGSDIKTVMRDNYGVVDLTDAEALAIQNLDTNILDSKSAKAYIDTLIDKGRKNIAIQAIIGYIIADRSNLMFTTYGHTGEDVVLYSYLPNNRRITGTIDNTDIGKYMATALDLDLNATTEMLFFSETDIPTDINITKEAKTLTLEKGGTKVILQRNKNRASVNGDEQKLDGVVVFNDTKWYFPAQVLDFFK